MSGLVPKKVLVVGGEGSRIGGGLVKGFLDEGHVVVQTICKSIRQKGLHPRLSGYRMDATREVRVEEQVSRIWRRHGDIDVLIYNSGVLSDTDVSSMTADQWREVLSVNLDGLFYVCKHVARRMVRAGGGCIISIASLLGTSGSQRQANYAASKGGCIAFTRSLALELAPFGIPVNAVCPGFIPSRLNGYSSRKTSKARSRSAMDISFNLPDLVNFVLFLASGKLRSVTGQVFHIDSRI